jgi:hypothetical protein
MTTPAAPSPQPGFPLTFSWFQVWRSALTRPSVATYADLLLDPKVSLRRAAAWLYLSALLSYLAGVGIQAAVFPSALAQVIRDAGQTAPQGLQMAPTVLLVLSLACTPFLAALFLVLYLVGFGILHFIASSLGSQGSFTDLVYAHAAFQAPLTLLTTLIGMIPLVNCLTLPMALYSFGLQLLALKAATRMSWGRVTAVLLIIVLLIGLVAAVIALGLIAPELEQWMRSSGVNF